MSDNFSIQNNTKLTNDIDVDNNLEILTELTNSDNLSELNLSCDHMYATNNENGVLDVNEDDDEEVNCQNAESEVSFFKDWLLYHLDLIQQQNEEILSKERTILLLRQENEKLKERLIAAENGNNVAQFQSNNKLNKNNSLNNTRDYSANNVIETTSMTQNLMEDDDNNSAEVALVPSDISNSDDVNIIDINVRHEYNDIIEDKHMLNQCDTSSTNNDKSTTEIEVKEEDNKLIVNSDIDGTSQNTPVNSSDFTLNNTTSESVGFNLLSANVKCKRRCSNSSLISNNDSNSEDRKNFRRSPKKKRRSMRNEKIVTCNEEYVTGTCDGYSIDQPLAMEVAASATNSTTLEVPRWRVKVYTSCYTMEGTENLDDDVYNRRHSRLENDERRRKRWDVQRIREQRIIEKLKQRQERTLSGGQQEQNDPIESLWPTLEDIRYLQVCDELPVSAFGSPVPRTDYSDFSLPWTNNPNIAVKKTRKTTNRRNRTKR